MEDYFDKMDLGTLGGALGINGAYQNESKESFKKRFEDAHEHEKLTFYSRKGNAVNFINKNYSYIMGAFQTIVQNKVYYVVIYKH